jgi:hypothetical protein
VRAAEPKDAVPPGGAGRVDVVALGEVPAAAVVAGAAAQQHRGQHYPVAVAEVADVGADLLDHADGFVAEDLARLHARHGAPDEVQVGAADRGGGDPNDGIGRLLDLRFGDGLEADISNVVPHDCLHGLPLCPGPRSEA